MKAWTRALAGLGVALTTSDAIETRAATAAVSAAVPELQQRWRYVRAPGLDVISSCSDQVTKAYLERAYQGMSLMALPPEFTAPNGLPLRLILASRPADEELAPPTAPPYLRKLRATRGVEYTWGEDPDLHVMLVSLHDTSKTRSDVHVYGLSLRILPFIVGSQRPPPPDWLWHGLRMIYREGESTAEIKGTTIAWPTADNLKVIKDAVRQPDKLMALPDFFAVDRASLDDAARERWDAQAALFMRFGLYGERVHPDHFWRFCVIALEQPISETLFRSHFRLSYVEARIRLSEHLVKGLAEPVHLYAPKGATPPTLALRDATRSEVCRIHAEWQRLVAGMIDRRHPALAATYRERASRTLRHAYEAGDRDAALLAELGIAAVEAKDDAGAREWLEQAAAAGTIPSRAWRELARLRSQKENAAPAGAQGKLAAAQVQSILQPLEMSRALVPLTLDTYRLLLALWISAEVPPDANQRAGLMEGSVRFPRDREYALKLASFFAAHGWKAEAASVVRRAQAFTASAEQRQALEAALTGPSVAP